MKYSGAVKFANNLDEQLRTNKRSARWLSTQIGMSNVTISKYLNCHTEPTLTAIGAMARALSIDYKDLLEGIETEEL